MRKKLFGILALSLIAVLCFSIGLVGCGKGNSAGKNPRIIIEIDTDELVFETGTQYTLPYAGVYDENLDRVDGKEIKMSVKNMGVSDEERAYLIKDSLDYSTLRFYTKGVYNIIYSAEGVPDAVIVVYVCRRLDMAENFVVNGNTLTWDAVANAEGYKVTVNGGEEQVVSDCSFQSDIFGTAGFYVGVTAIGDNREYIDSYMASYKNRIPLVWNDEPGTEGYGTGELAAFNDPCYELDIEPGNPGVKVNPAPSEVEWLSEQECLGSNGGALKMLIKSGAYGFGNFRILLQRTFDTGYKMEEYTTEGSTEIKQRWVKETDPSAGRYDVEYIEIRFKLDTKDYTANDGSTPTSLFISKPDELDIQARNGIVLNRDLNNEWQILQVPAANQSSYDVERYIQLNLYNMVRSLGKGYLYLDYIRLCKGVVEAPTNLQLSADKLTFDAVEDAGSYQVLVGLLSGTTLADKVYNVTSNQVNLTDLGINPADATEQYEIKVKSISSDKTKASSDWSESAIKRIAPSGNVLASMDNPFYGKDFNTTIISSYLGASKYDHVRSTEYTSVAGADGDGAIKIKFSNDGWANSFFTLNLPKPLDLDTYDVMVIRFMVEESNNTNYQLGLQLVGPSRDSQNYAGLNFRKEAPIGQWLDLVLTMDDLKNYYETGDTKLCFAFKNNAAGEAKPVTTIAYFDYIVMKNAIATPTGLSVSQQGVVTWNAVNGASSYEVDVDGTKTIVTDTTYTLTDLTKSATIRVCAIPQDQTLYKSFDVKVAFEPYDPSVIMSFNSDAYLDNLVAGSSVVKSAQPTYDGNFNQAPSFGTTVAGADGNAVEFAVFNTVYTKGTGLGIKIHTFFLNLDSGLNLTDNGSITIRFACKSVSADTSGNKLYFTMLSAKTKTAGYTDDVSTLDGVAYVELVEKNTWYTLTVTKEQLIALGYTDGDTQLAFGVQRTDGTAHWGQIAGFFAIDYVKYGN